MFSSLSVTTAPTVPVVSTVLAKQHCRIDGVTEDILVAMYVASATALAEKFLNRALITQTLLWTMKPQLPNWPEGYLLGNRVLGFNSFDRGRIALPRPIVQSIASVTIVDNTATSFTVPSSAYTADLLLEPARINLGIDLLSPGPTYPLENVQISFVAGYGSTAAAVPMPIVNAILLITAWLYEHRGDSGETEIPRAAESLLWPYRVVSFRD